MYRIPCGYNPTQACLVRATQVRIPTIRGLIDRRILANFRVDPDVLSTVLPAPFRPQIFNGFGVAGINIYVRSSCLPSSAFRRKTPLIELPLNGKRTVNYALASSSLVVILRR